MRRRIVALFLIAGFLGSQAIPDARAQNTAVLQGLILDPVGAPAAGFRAVFENAKTGERFQSAPSSKEGTYTLTVPTNAKYLLVGVVTPDGETLPVKQMAPLPVMEPSTFTLDVQFWWLEPPDGQEDDDGPPLAMPLRTTPWYKKPWGVIGIVLGTGAVALTIGGGDDDPPTPSPTTP